MQVAVVSDTHDNIYAIDEIVRKIKDRGIETVIHLGDFVAPFSLRRFAGLKLYGVFGNNDGEKILLKKVAEEHNFVIEDAPLELEFKGLKIVAIHGAGSVEKTRKLAENLAHGHYDFVLYGHTHRTDLRKFGKAVVHNPGEACGYLTGKRSFSIINMDNGDVEIIEF